MATALEIRTQIKSVKNIAKVTGALETVSASRVRRAQSQALATRPYANAAMEILHDIASAQSGEMSHPLLDTRTAVKNVCIVMITSDRGLAGPYNGNVVRAAYEMEKKQTVPVRYIAVGKKGRDMVLRRGGQLIAEFSDLPATPTILDIRPIVRTAVDDFLNGAVDEVYLAYTKFVNMLRQEALVERWLPLQPIFEHLAPGRQSAPSGPAAVYTFEPDPAAVLNEILPRFTELQLYHALLEALASEHSARMVAMRSATDNANALADDLTLQYNKARQLAITNEILDIVGGAEALAQSISD